MQIRSWADYEYFYKNSLEHSDEFWSAVAEYKIKWRKQWSQVSEIDFNLGKINWFLGAELNVSENCLDRHLESGKGDQIALIWVGNHPNEEKIFTFRELYREVCRASNALEALGVEKGDRVVLYLPNIPEVVISILACARIGAIHSVIFGGFSAHSIQSRVNDCGAKLILTATGTYRGNKWIDLKANIDEAMALGCPSVTKVIVCERDSAHGFFSQSYDLKWAEWLDRFGSENHLGASHSAGDPLFILYTSGSTGKPKGVLHRMGGYLTYAAYTYDIVFQPKENDIYWCTADVGWITGHSYSIYGPLANGVATLIYEGVPNYPDPGRFWRIIDQYQVAIFYTAPTALRILASAGDDFVKKYSRHSLRVLGTVGEPISPETWQWYDEVVGEKRAPIVDTWWQTETGGILISPLAGISPTKPGSASFPLPGIEPKILDDAGKEKLGSGPGTLVLARSWPGQMAGIYGDPERFYKTYFAPYPGYYWTGDGAQRDDEGFYWITGRTDDVIKISGHRLGTAEVESACLVHPFVSESAAVGVPDPITGESLQIFVLLKEGLKGSEQLAQELMDLVRKEVGSIVSLKKVYWVPGLPKTRSGKIMRRILRKMAQGEKTHFGDLSSLADPAIIEMILAILE